MRFLGLQSVWRTEDLISIIYFLVEIFLERSGAKNVKLDTFLISHYNKGISDDYYGSVVGT